MCLLSWSRARRLSKKRNRCRVYTQVVADMSSELQSALNNGSSGGGSDGGSGSGLTLSAGRSVVIGRYLHPWPPP